MIKKLIKIGGSSILNKENFNNLINLINSKDNDNSIFIISAFGKTSQILKNIAISAKNNDIKDIEKELNKFFDFFASLTDVKVDLSKYYENLLRILIGINITKELTNKIMDKILAYGELISTELIKNYILEEIFIFDATDVIITDSNYGNANPIIEISREKFTKIIEQNRAIKYLTQGFIGKDINNNITTMGFESSNLTAVLFANFLDLKEIFIYTNVNGIRNIDPNLSEETKCIYSIDYDNAYNLSMLGLKLIYPKMIEIAKKNNIQILYKNFNNSNQEFTLINSNTQLKDSILLFHKLNNKSDNNSFIYYNDNLINFRYNIANNSEDVSDVIFILYNINQNNFFKFIINSLDISKFRIDNYNKNCIKIIAGKNDFNNILEKLILYINN